MKSIVIEFIKPEEFRFQTIPNYGDYGETDQSIWFNILDTGNPIYNLALTIHELFEKIVKDRDGVPDSVVDEWDLAHPEADEPGEVEGCPYGSQHASASLLERMVLCLANEKWKEYDAALNAFCPEQKPLSSNQMGGI